MLARIRRAWNELTHAGDVPLSRRESFHMQGEILALRAMFIALVGDAMGAEQGRAFLDSVKASALRAVAGAQLDAEDPNYVIPVRRAAEKAIHETFAALVVDR
jgi:hypothetical protein